MRIQFLLKNTGMYERLGIMTLSSVLKGKGHEVQLLLSEELGENEIIRKVKIYKPHILAYSIMTGEHSYHIELNKMVRTHYNDALSVFGGPHPTYSPGMIHKEYVDAICRGEGEIYFPQLIEKYSKNEDYFNTPNFWFKKKDGSIITNELGDLVEDLDKLPNPDRKLMYDADTQLRARGSKLFMSNRGCPYKCTYCFNHAYNKMTKGHGDMMRYRSVDSVIEEIREVKDNYFLDRVNIDDDIFLLKPKGWLEEFAEKYPKEIGLPILCNVRPNMVSDRVGRLLSKSNVTHVSMGIECGNNEIATKLLKRATKNEKIIEAAEIFNKYKIKVYTLNLVGLPVEDPLKIDLETLDFNLKLKPDFAWSSILYPYPGTELGEIASRHGFFDADFNKVQISNKSESNMNLGDKKTNLQINNLHKLMGVIVQFPFLRPFTKFLISLPFTRFYGYIYFAFYGYKLLRQSSLKGIAKNLWQYIVFYFKYVGRLEKKIKFKNILSKNVSSAESETNKI